ncbi:hypothetical protein [Burkholderia vietnamiensis]|nr:hypothetical protein [Burkholderia vietnamiensis]
MTSFGDFCRRCGARWVNVPRCPRCGRITRMAAMGRMWRMGRGRK